MRMRCRRPGLLIFVLCCYLMVLGGCGARQGEALAPPGYDQNAELEQESISAQAPDGLESLTIQFLDVGQADCILFTTASNEAMLIDAGNNADGEGIVQYLREQGVEGLRYVIGTHPHEDHIGGLDDVIRAFPIEELMMSKVMTQTVTFESVLDAAMEKGLSITAPGVGDVFTFGEGSYQILSIGEDEENLNSSSIVIRMTYGDLHFIFTGDAEQDAEERMLNSGLPLSADILKVGHHGSETSSSADFLQAVAPRDCVISVGKDNAYGHPATSVLERLEPEHTYRTDQLGTVVVTTDGQQYEIHWKQTEIDGNGGLPGNPAESGSDIQGAKVYVTESGKKYHRETCSSLKNSKIPMSLEEAKAKGYEPCGTCNPQE